MRLIDADALDSVVFHLNTEGKQITRSEYKLIDNVIFEFPTIEAIPIEWLERWFKERFKSNTYNHLIADWEKQNKKEAE